MTTPWVVTIVMGASGCGKTTLGQALARHVGSRFCDADDLHPAQNRAKMARGEALNDRDRQPWLAALGQLIDDHLARAQPLVLACSALKAAYRDQLRCAHPRVGLIYLRADAALLTERLATRRGHFFPPALLASQLAALEAPTDAVVLDAARPVAQLIELIDQRCGPPAAPPRAHR
ncbi:MAG: gluconokinase [Haliangiales bacterium]